MAVILRTEDLFKDFSGLEIIRGITMEVYEGERHMIIGPNGAGKSTLFNLITGLYKPSRGRIHFSSGTSPAFLSTRLPGWASPDLFRSSMSSP